MIPRATLPLAKVVTMSKLVFSLSNNVYATHLLTLRHPSVTAQASLCWDLVSVSHSSSHQIWFHALTQPLFHRPLRQLKAEFQFNWNLKRHGSRKTQPQALLNSRMTFILLRQIWTAVTHQTVRERRRGVNSKRKKISMLPMLLTISIVTRSLSSWKRTFSCEEMKEGNCF